MVSRLTGSGAGPTQGFIAVGANSVSSGFGYLGTYSFRKNLLIPNLTPTQPTGITFRVASVAWSGDGKYLAALMERDGMKFFERNESSFTSKSVPQNVNFANNRKGNNVSISSNGEYVAAASYYSPYFRLWHNNNGTISNISNIGTAFIDDVYSCALSSNGDFVAITYEDLPYFSIRKRSGFGAAATYADISVAPAFGYACAFSPDDTYLSVGNYIYKFNPSTLEYDQLSSPFVGSVPSNSSIYSCSWNSNGTMLALGTERSGTYIYSRSSDTFTGVAVLPGRDEYGGNFHPSGDYYINGESSIYQRLTDTNWVLKQTLSNYSEFAAFSPYI